MKGRQDGDGETAQNHRYGQRVIKRLSETLTKQYGRGFSVDILENARRFFWHIRVEFPKHCFGNLL
ncbi:MAG: hypothetical protein NC434_12485 [Ruminococcus sp.]|nr:hypothetical protein [Ruminococcus sp.]